MFQRSSGARQKNSSNPVRFAPRFKLHVPDQPLTLWICDGLLAALVLIFPFIMGGREAWGHRILISLALILGFCWSLHKVRTGGRFRLLALEPLLIGGLLLVWFQTVPLGQGVLAQLSSEYVRLLPHWGETQEVNSDAAVLPTWNTSSLIPAETKHAFWMLLSYGIIGVVVSQRLESERDCYVLLKLIGISGVLMAAFAVLQFAFSNDRFFWFYRQPYTGTREVLKGAFTNRNHFAQFLALSVGPLIWWVLAGRQKPVPEVMHRRGLGPAQGNHSKFDDLIDPVMLFLLCAVGGVILSVMLSLSRGGMIAVALATIVTLAGLWKSGRVHASMAIVMVGTGIIAIGGLLAFGQEKVEDRVSQLASADADRIDPANARRTLWKADLDAIRAFPVAGTGVGSHRYVYPLYMEELGEFTGVSFSHAESSYIHLATETGLSGLSLAVAGLLYLVLRIVPGILFSPDRGRVAALSAVLAGLAGGMAHAAVDFIWYVPAIVNATVILAVIGLRLCSGFRPDHGLYMPRIGWLGCGFGCLLLVCQVQPDLARRVAGERLWFQTLIASFDADRAERDKATAAENLNDLDATGVQSDDENGGSEQTAEPASEKASYVSGREQDLRERTLKIQSRITLLMACLKADPNQPRAALLLADHCLDLFDLMQQQGENPYSAKDVRDIVRDQKFSTDAAMHAFLKRAFGNSVRLLVLADRLSRRSLAQCPIQDEGYEILADTAFVRDPEDSSHERMIAQTLLLGQHSPSTRFSVGKLLFRDGKREAALEQWRVAFHQKKEARLEICSILGRQHSVDVIFNEFKPTTEQLRDVLKAYSVYDRQADIETLLSAVIQEVSVTGDPDGSQERAELGASGREKLLMLLMEAYKSGYKYRLFEKCEELLTLATNCDPLAEAPRRALGLLLMQDLERYEEAARHFVWCYEQSPGDAKLEELLKECRRRITLEARDALRSAGTRKPGDARGVRPVSRSTGSSDPLGQ